MKQEDVVIGTRLSPAPGGHWYLTPKKLGYETNHEKTRKTKEVATEISDGPALSWVPNDGWEPTEKIVCVFFL